MLGPLQESEEKNREGMSSVRHNARTNTPFLCGHGRGVFTRLLSLPPVGHTLDLDDGERPQVLLGYFRRTLRFLSPDDGGGRDGI